MAAAVAAWLQGGGEHSAGESTPASGRAGVCRAGRFELGSGLCCAGGWSGDGDRTPSSACVPVPFLVLLGLGAHCQLCWGQEET